MYLENDNHCFTFKYKKATPNEHNQQNSGGMIFSWERILEKIYLAKLFPFGLKFIFREICSPGYVLTFLERNALVVFPKYFIHRILKSNSNISILSYPKSDSPKPCSYASRFSPKVHSLPCFTTILSVIISLHFIAPILTRRLSTIQSS